MRETGEPDRAGDTEPRRIRVATAQPYDVIIADEGQDIPPDAWLMLLNVLSDANGLVVFYDPGQELGDTHHEHASVITENLALEGPGGEPPVR